MLLETLIVGVIFVTLGSIALADAIDRREREEDARAERAEREAESARRAAELGYELLDFIGDDVKTCPKCGVFSGWVYMADNKREYRGMYKPVACGPKIKCPAKGVSHLHGACASCESTWMMHTADRG